MFSTFCEAFKLNTRTALEYRSLHDAAWIIFSNIGYKGHTRAALDYRSLFDTAWITSCNIRSKGHTPLLAGQNGDFTFKNRHFFSICKSFVLSYLKSQTFIMKFFRSYYGLRMYYEGCYINSWTTILKFNWKKCWWAVSSLYIQTNSKNPGQLDIKKQWTCQYFLSKNIVIGECGCKEL